MHKKNLLVVILLIFLAGAIIYPRLQPGSSAAENPEANPGADLSEESIIAAVAANPAAYLGPLTLSGRVGLVDSESSLFTIVDDNGCCAVPILIPKTAEHQKNLELDTLYRGELPVLGDLVVAEGTLVQDENGSFLFDVDTVTRDGEILLEKIN